MGKAGTNTLAIREFKEKLSLTPLQRQFVIGTLLGDGCLISSRSGNSARLQIRHQVKHKAYVEWKYSLIKDWVFTKPRVDKFNNSIYFRTVSHPDLMEIKKEFYPKNRKIIPACLEWRLTTPLALALWMMDDGNGYKHWPGFRINTYAFGLDGNVLLQNCLSKNFHLETHLVQDQKGYQLMFRKEAAKQLYGMIEPYLVDCMRYKFIKTCDNLR